LHLHFDDKIMNIQLNSERDTQQLAQQLAQLVQAGDIIFLNGDLGAGKTTFCRHFAQALGVTGRIKSPTYALVESYDLAAAPNGIQTLHHFDLYRLAEPREWFSAGFDEYLNPNCCAMIEWPAKAAGALPNADLVLDLSYMNDDCRQLDASAQTARGQAILSKWSTSAAFN
jgi:tRNA threonylcarbamoyladenosine biosynthesis protein TsaE